MAWKFKKNWLEAFGFQFWKIRYVILIATKCIKALDKRYNYMCKPFIGLLHAWLNFSNQFVPQTLLKYLKIQVKSDNLHGNFDFKIVNKQLIFSWITMHHQKLSFVLSWKTLMHLKLDWFFHEKTADTFAGFVFDDPVYISKDGIE